MRTTDIFGAGTDDIQQLVDDQVHTFHRRLFQTLDLFLNDKFERLVRCE